MFHKSAPKFEPEQVFQPAHILSEALLKSSSFSSCSGGDRQVCGLSVGKVWLQQGLV